MNRDLELIRKIVLAIEDSPSGWSPDLKFEGYSNDQIGYHAYLLIDAGLAKGTEVTTCGSIAPEGFIQNLTWAGHEFAAAARDETRWKTAMGVVQEKGGTVTIGVLIQLLVAIMKNVFGLS